MSTLPGPELFLEANDPPARRGEPVTCGVPWPRGALTDPAQLRLENDQEQAVPLQTRVLDRWADGSVRWLLLDWQAHADGATRYRLVQGQAAPIVSAIKVTSGADGLVIDTGAARFAVRAGERFPFWSAGSAIDPERTTFIVEDESGHVSQATTRSVHLEESGPLRVSVRVVGGLSGPAGKPLLDLKAHLHFFAASATVRVILALCNPRKADHPGGLWDLGNGGSVHLRDAAFTVALSPASGQSEARACFEAGSAFEPFALPLEIYQDSSGGANWRSTNHMNRHRIVPTSFRGYRVRADGVERSGLRSTPSVGLRRGDYELAMAMHQFWQNFPKAIEANGDSLTLRLFPRQFADTHELQGGEQKTHTFYVAFGRDAVTEEPLAWCLAPLLPRAAPAWYGASGALSYLTPKTEDPNADYLQLVDAAIEGDDSFEQKREVIDEYGWRHFGDIYGDHEAVFHKGPAPLVSHYNNQYDPVAGAACQFLRSGDARWWRLMDELAAHVEDIDLYHTDQDKTAYNHGLFWHTFHYVDADTATHRSYPRAARVCGGGPADEQNYATGLMLHHFLTGSPRSREAAVGLARWVIDMDDGNKTVFRWIDRGYTGLASSSRTPDYHGPGRGPGNSIRTLMDGFQLTADRAFLDKAEQLIRRCIHPADDVPARNLLDAENRWFYTMTLQALGRYLDDKAALGQLDRMYAYARASLLHYARWMADHEYPFLEKPEILEYPTETWAAQDMRKSEVFRFAALHAQDAERERFTERADFFFRYSTTTLAGMKTRTLARPVVLLMAHGFMDAYFRRHPHDARPMPTVAVTDFGRPEVFVPQKARVKKRLKVLAAASVAIVLLALATGLYLWI